MPDALQEFSVQTNGVPARYGLHPGAVINAVTKSGTNSIHGDLFEFVRNGDFNARNTFAATQDSLRRNQYGGTVGGPIRKDKLFIFGGFQATRERTAPPQTISYVPTQAVLNGNFSTLESGACQSNGKPVQLIDPSNGTPFANNQIPVGRFSTPILNLAKLIPISADPTGCGKLVYGIPSPNNENQFVGRMDWVQNAKHTFYGRYFITDYADPVFYTNNILTTTRSGLDERDQTLTFGDQYIFSPTVFNAVHATAARLFMNLREEHGYTYGAYSQLVARRYAGPWLANGSMRTDATEGAMTEFMNEINRIRDQKVPEKELEECKQSIVASFALSLEDPGQLLDYAMTLKIFGLPADYWDTYPAKITGITAEQVQRVARKYVVPENLQIVAVGDATKIKPVLDKYGAVEVYGTDGKKK